jgi:hypothetical protein
MGFWSKLFGVKDESKPPPKFEPTKPDATLRRLQTFQDATLHRKRAFDNGSAGYDESELCLLNIAYSYLEKTLAANFQELRRLGLTKGDLVFDILDDRDVNALASNKEGHDALCLNAGLPICLYLLYSRIAQFPSAFPWVGTAMMERDLPPPLDALPVSVSQLVAQTPTNLTSGKPLIPIAPEDRDRHAFVMYLWKWSLLFIVFHELGHLAHGHVEFFLRGSSGKPFEEIADMATKSAVLQSAGLTGAAWAELRQGQERQADRFAAALVFIPLFNNSHLLPPFLSNVTESGFNRLPYAFGFALATIFTVFACLEKEVKYDRIGFTHPNPFERLNSALFAPLTFLCESVKPKSAPNTKLLDEIHTGWQDLDRLLEMAFGKMFRGFFTNERPVFLISLESLARTYAHEEKWSPFDRIKRHSGGGQLRLEIFAD